ncbi:MAG: MFS transporter [Propionicimonas sp.]
MGDREYSRIAWGLFAAGFATFALVFDAQAALPAISAAFDTTTATAALTVSATTLGLAASVLVWAVVADRIGRVQAMRLSLVAALALSLGLGFADQLWQLIALRGLLGVALGAVPGVAMAYLAEELAPSRVSIAAGIFVAGNTVGGIVGRLVAGLASAVWGWQVGFGLVAAIAIAMSSVFLFSAPPPRGFVPGGRADYPLPTRILFQLRDPTMMGLYAQGFLLMGSFGAIYNYLGFRLIAEPFRLPATWASLVFLAYLAGTAASRWGGVLALRWGHLRVILAGIGVQLTGIALLASGTLGLTLAGLVVFTVGCFTAHPVASGLTGQRARLGRAQGTALYQLAWLSGTAIFGWLAGLLFDRWGWSAVLVLVAGLCLGAAGLGWLGLHTLAHRRPELPALPSVTPAA